MAATPTRSLKPAPNAAARMQEVLRRQADPLPAPEEDSGTGDYATALPEGSTTALPEGSTTSNEATERDVHANTGAGKLLAGSGDEDSGEEPSPAKTRRRVRKPLEDVGIAVARTTGNTDLHTDSSKPAKATSSTTYSATVLNPVRQAMIEMLAQPYPADMADGVMTVTSVKIPKPVWERLEYARTITKKDKQDIIAEALRLYFDRIVVGSAE